MSVWSPDHFAPESTELSTLHDGTNAYRPVGAGMLLVEIYVCRSGIDLLVSNVYVDFER